MRTFLTAIAISSIALSPAWANPPPPPSHNNPPPNNGGSTNNAKADAAAIAAAAAAARANARATGGNAAGGAGGNAAGGAGGSASTAPISVTNNNQGAGANSGNGNGAGNGWQGTQFPASTATAPSFAIGQCQYAISGGLQVLIFGASGGGAGLYEFCQAMIKADHFRKLGREDMAKIVECNYGEFRTAYRDAGTPCRADVPKAEQATTPIVQPAGFVAPSSAPSTVNASATPQGRAPQCFNSAGLPVAIGTPGAVRCN